MNNQKTNLADLPKSDDEYWDGAETYVNSPSVVTLCEDHFKGQWLQHKGYVQESDGTITCTQCPWGTKVAGYYKVIDGKMVDLRTQNGE